MGTVYSQHSNKPLITVVTVCFNASKTIGRTISSLAKQTYSNFEWIVCDGGSTDETLSMIYDSNIKQLDLVSEPDNGIYDAMNKGLVRTQGMFVLFLNAGDSFHSSETLSQIAESIVSNDYPDIVYGQTDIVDIEGNKVAERHLRAPKRLTFSSFKNGMVVCHQSFVVKREIAPMYDLRYRYSSDYDWCICCLQRSKKNVYLDGTIADFLNEGQTTGHRISSLRERLRIMYEYYGLMCALWQHIKFLPRFLRRRLEERKVGTPLP